MASSASSTEGSNAKTIKIVAVIALLCGAGFYFYWSQRGEGQLDTPESASWYICPTDGETLSVTPAAFQKMLDSGAAGSMEGAAARAPGLYLRCPKCGKRIMVSAVKCLKDGTIFAVAGKDGQPGTCPKCGGKAPH